MICRCCKTANPRFLFAGEIFGLRVSYFECELCGYVQTENPTWLEKAYSSSINMSDTGILVRNNSNVNLVLSALTLLGERSGRVVDYAGGHGFLVRLLRDKGVDAYWADPYSANLVARGFEFTGGSASLVTAFEAFEHFVHPLDEIEALLSISPNILLTTEIIASPAPKPADWWYYGLEHGQHIGFFRMKTLNYLASKFRLKLISNRKSLHFLTKEKHSHLLWQAINKASRLAPRFLEIGLKSKTWSDYTKLSSILSSKK